MLYYLITLLVLLTASKANFLYHNDICWLVIDVLMIWVAIQKGRMEMKDLNRFLIFAAGYIVFIFLRNVLFNQLPFSYLFSDLNFLFKFILFSFLFCVVLRDQAVSYFIKVTTHLALISFLFYLVHLINNDVIFRMGAIINFAPDVSPEGTVNLLFFNYHSDFGIRNAGFCWEPGAYGGFLTLALLLQLLSNGFSFDNTAKVLVLIMLTTLSTTTYLALVIVLLLYYRVKIGRFNIGFIALLCLLAVLFVEVPFLNNKIIEVYNEDFSRLNDIDDLIGWYDGVGKEMALNRFASISFILSNFGLNILWGISNQYTALFSNIYNISISNGLIDFCAKFGVIGLVYFFINYAKFCKKYVSGFELTFYCCLIMFLICFGEPLLILPLFLSFLFLHTYDINEEAPTEEGA